MQTVSVFLKIDDMLTFEAIVQSMPVWVAVTDSSIQFIETLTVNRRDLSITRFGIGDQESPEDAIRRISFSLDDHYNDLAQKEGYKYLIVFGAQLTDAIILDLRENAFSEFERTKFGFVAKKS